MTLFVFTQDNYPKEVLEVSINTSDSRLSKEESGSVLIMQDESKNNSIGPLCLEEVGLQFIQSVD